MNSKFLPHGEGSLKKSRRAREKRLREPVPAVRANKSI